MASLFLHLLKYFKYFYCNSLFNHILTTNIAQGDEKDYRVQERSLIFEYIPEIRLFFHWLRHLLKRPGSRKPFLSISFTGSQLRLSHTIPHTITTGVHSITSFILLMFLYTQKKIKKKQKKWCYKEQKVFWMVILNV